MIITKNYDVMEAKDGILAIKSHDAPYCPSCKILMSGYDTRLRHCIGGDGVSRWYALRRLRCPSCKRIHLEIPDFMKPKKHYNAKTICDAISGTREDCPAEDSTIRRWKKQPTRFASKKTVC